MKLVDKMILFSRFLRNNKDHKLELDELLEIRKAYFQEQSHYWKDKSLYNDLDSNLDNLKQISDEYNSILSKINKKIEDLLRKEELVVLRRDYDVYSKREHTFDLIQERALRDQEFIKEISADVGYYSDWRWAGVELNPSNGMLTSSMLACDPLYLYTRNIADTDSIRNKFNRFFADKRLMFYNDLDNLPQGQLGLATSINCYEFWPIDPIKDEMRKVYNILCPGGYFIFTYNDCELEASLDLCAGNQGYRTYNTKTLMKSMVEMLGFDVVTEKCYRAANSWMVVKKPGDLTTQKLSAPLVRIVEKPKK
jgi:hypothetical protein